MDIKIDIDAGAAKDLTKRLEGLYKYALPSAIRTTLSSGGFDVKQKTMLKKTRDTFTIRQNNFFKANSRVEKAKGNDINAMKATVGFVEGKLKGANNYAVKDLEQQEEGGDIGGRKFIPMNTARIAKSAGKNVRSANRISGILGKNVDSRLSKGKNAKERFIRAAVHAGVGGYVEGNRRTGKGNRTLFRIKRLTRKKGRTKLKLEPLFTIQNKKTVDPKATHFMRKASLETAKKLPSFYEKEAKKQIAKYTK